MVLCVDLRKEASLTIIHIVVSLLFSVSLTLLVAILGSPTTATEWAWFFVAIWAILELSDISAALRNMRDACKDVRVQVMTKSELPLRVELQKDIR